MTTNAVQKYYGQMAGKLASAAMQRELMKAAGKNFDLTKYLRIVLTVFQRNPALLQCTEKSLLSCVFAGVQLNLSYEPALGQAYMVPYKDNKRGTMIANFIPGYRGLIALAYRSGLVRAISGDVVYSKDSFEFSKGINPVCRWSPSFESDRGEFRGAFSVIKFTDGEADAEFMTASQIDAIRERSKAAKSGPWITDVDEMRKKTVFRRHIKIAPVAVDDPKLSTAVHAENLFLDGEDSTGLFIDDSVEVKSIEGDPQAAKEKSRYNIDRDFEIGFVDMIEKHKTDLDDFVKLTAAGNERASVEDVKRAALDDPKAFRAGFRQYLDAKKPQTDKKPPEPKKPTASQAEISTQKQNAYHDKGEGSKTAPSSPQPANQDEIADVLRSIPTRFRPTPEYRDIENMSKIDPDSVIDALVGREISTIEGLRELWADLKSIVEDGPGNAHSDRDPLFDEPPPPDSEIPGGF